MLARASAQQRPDRPEGDASHGRRRPGVAAHQLATRVQRKCAACARAEEEGRPQPCPECAAERGVQLASAAGTSGDPHEREADETARRVVRTAPAHPPPERPTPVRLAPGPPGVSGAGRPLDTAVRADLEPRFGASFADVRIHTGGDAAGAARDLNARAYTAGSHIVFGHGEYRPQTTPGRLLLAHELTHVLQQRAGRPGGVQRAVDTNYDIDETIHVLRVALTSTLVVLKEPLLEAPRRERLTAQFNKLLPMVAKLEGARATDGAGVEFGFDPTPAKNEINPGDAAKPLAELYGDAVPVPQGRAPKVSAPANLQAWALPGGLTITPYHGGGPQRCEAICWGVILLAGLLLSGCRSSSPAASGPCTPAQTNEINSEHTRGLTWVTTAKDKLTQYVAGGIAAADRTTVETALTANFHATDATTARAVLDRLGTIHAHMTARRSAYKCECRGTADAYALGTEIHFCGRWFSSAANRKTTTMIHEIGHATGLEGSLPLSSGRAEDIYEFHPGYATTPTRTALMNPDPFAVLCRQIALNGAEPPGTYR